MKLAQSHLFHNLRGHQQRNGERAFNSQSLGNKWLPCIFFKHVFQRLTLRMFSVKCLNSSTCTPSPRVIHWSVVVSREQLSNSWWRHQMKKNSALLALCEGNPPVTGWFPSQMPVTRSFDVFCDLRLNNRLSQQSRRRWFGTPSRSFWRHCDVAILVTLSLAIHLVDIRSRICMCKLPVRDDSITSLIMRDYDNVWP